MLRAGVYAVTAWAAASAASPPQPNIHVGVVTQAHEGSGVTSTWIGGATLSPTPGPTPIVCPAGKYYPKGERAMYPYKKSWCFKCGKGKFGQLTNGHGACYTCPAGQYNPVAGMSFCFQKAAKATPAPTPAPKCPVGRFDMTDVRYRALPNVVAVGGLHCVLCPSGKFDQRNGTSNVAGCVECPFSKYQDVYGKTSCFNCAAGKIQPFPGQSRCVPRHAVQAAIRRSSNQDPRTIIRALNLKVVHLTPAQLPPASLVPTRKDYGDCPKVKCPIGQYSAKHPGRQKLEFAVCWDARQICVD